MGIAPRACRLEGNLVGYRLALTHSGLTAEAAADDCSKSYQAAP